MALATWIDGKAADNWPTDDRSIAYGDGLFETIAVDAGRPRLLDYHRERLQHGSRRLGLALPPDRLWEEVAALARTPGCGVVKVIWSRGSGPGYRPTTAMVERRLVMALSAPLQPPDAAQAGVRVRICGIRLGSQPALAGLKHLNRLEQVLARSEWHDPAIAEGLMMDHGGALIEATQSNLFLVRAGCLETPRLDQCGVAGVVRRLLLERLAPEQGLEARCRRLHLADLLTSDEVFLTSSQIGIWPVVAVDCWQRPVGPLTRRLQNAWKRSQEAGFGS